MVTSLREQDGVIYSELSPVRDPDHRHQKSKKLIASGEKRDPDGDEVVNELIGYEMLKREDDPHCELWIESCYPGIHQAMKLHMGRNRRAKLNIQCGVLADVGWDRIMQVVPGCDQETIAAYELCFFDIRPHLENASFIVETVMEGVCPQTSLSLPELSARSRYGDLRLAVAYWGGWDQHLSFNEDPRGFSQETEMILRKIGMRSELCKSVLASLAQTVTEKNAGYIVEQLREMARRQAEGDQPSKTTTDDLVQKLGEIAESDPMRTANENELTGAREYCHAAERQ